MPEKAKIDKLAAKIVYLSPERPTKNGKLFRIAGILCKRLIPIFLFNSSYFCQGLRDHKGERISVNLFGNIAETVKEDKASVIFEKKVSHCYYLKLFES